VLLRAPPGHNIANDLRGEFPRAYTILLHPGAKAGEVKRLPSVIGCWRRGNFLRGST